jgi:DNA repair protein RadC
MDTNEAVQKAMKSYAQNARDWKFLGYSETLAIAILTEFFSMRKVRNPSPKPLNVLSMVGKSRVVQLREQVDATLRAETASATKTGEDVLESEEESNE